MHYVLVLRRRSVKFVSVCADVSSPWWRAGEIDYLLSFLLKENRLSVILPYGGGLTLKDKRAGGAALIPNLFPVFGFCKNGWPLVMGCKTSLNIPATQTTFTLHTLNQLKAIDSFIWTASLNIYLLPKANVSLTARWQHQLCSLHWVCYLTLSLL